MQAQYSMYIKQEGAHGRHGLLWLVWQQLRQHGTPMATAWHWLMLQGLTR
jgi:hypothetical protein